MRKVIVIFGLLMAILLPVTPALAKSFSLPQAAIHVEVGRDGAVTVQELLTYSFDGDFQGGYREIPLRQGETIVGVQVSEDGQPYTFGAPTELGSTGQPGTFGTTAIEDGLRIVWHYRAANEPRTFEITYTVSGLAVAYDDVVDVNLQVWGDEWSVPLDRLQASMKLPGRAPGEVLVWGHPASVEGFAELKTRGRRRFTRGFERRCRSVRRDAGGLPAATSHLPQQSSGG